MEPFMRYLEMNSDSGRAARPPPPDGLDPVMKRLLRSADSEPEEFWGALAESERTNQPKPKAAAAVRENRGINVEFFICKDVLTPY